MKRVVVCAIVLLTMFMTACNGPDTEPTATTPTDTNKATVIPTDKPTEKPTDKPTDPPTKEPEEKVEYYDLNFKVGSIRGTTGVDFENATRFVSDGYIAIKDIQAVTVNSGYHLSWFAYDAEYNYLGNGSNTYPKLPTQGVWLGAGKGVSTKEILDWNKDTRYIRFAVKKSNESSISLEEDVRLSDVKVYVSGYENLNIKMDYTKVGSISGGVQDGAVHREYMFSFNSYGKCKVYTLNGFAPVSEFTLDKNNILSPHSNAVCFGTEKYDDTDELPLLYCNIYNTYSKDRMLDGTCNVYRITREGTTFESELVQIIKIGFTSDTERWSSPNGDTRPYGNFAVDTDKNKLYAFTMRDASSTTRFFEFELPTLADGTVDSSTGVNKVTLEVSDILRSFDVDYSRYVQGATYFDGKIYSLEGFTNDFKNKAAMKIVDLESGKLISNVDLFGMGLTKEPEMVYAVDGEVYYAVYSGEIYKIG